MNTAIAAMMTLVNEFYANGVSRGDLRILLLLLKPVCPAHHRGDVGEPGLRQAAARWPARAVAACTTRARPSTTSVEMAVQVNGKLRGTVTVPTDSDEKTVVDEALELEKVRKAVRGHADRQDHPISKTSLVNLIAKVKGLGGFAQIVPIACNIILDNNLGKSV
jgi:leucyl-tRNA synthetase